MIQRKSMARVLAGSVISIAWGGLGCLSMQSQTSLDGGTAATNASSQPYVEAYVEYAGPQAKWAGPVSYMLHVTAKEAGLAQITTTPALLRGESPSMSEPPTVSQRTPASSASIALSPGASPHGKQLGDEGLGHHSIAPAHGQVSHEGAEHEVAANGASVSAIEHEGAPASHEAAPAATGVGMTSEAAREQLAHLAAALQGAQAPFHGCMSPVRVRLVRADGGIYERQGCRSEQGWSRVVSEAVSVFTEAAWRSGGGSATVAASRAVASEHH